MTDLNEKAIAAWTKARAEVAAGLPGSERIRAVKHLYDATGMRLSECVPLLKWAEERSGSAADLPDGSVVARRDAVYIKNHPNDWHEWRSTSRGYADNFTVDGYLRDGAVVLRVGYGKE